MIGVSEIKLPLKIRNNNTEVTLSLSIIKVAYIQMSWFQPLSSRHEYLETSPWTVDYFLTSYRLNSQSNNVEMTHY